MKLGTLIANVAGAPIKKRLQSMGVNDIAGAIAANGDAIKAQLKKMGIKDPDAFLQQNSGAFLKQMGSAPEKAKA